MRLHCCQLLLLRQQKLLHLGLVDWHGTANKCRCEGRNIDIAHLILKLGVIFLVPSLKGLFRPKLFQLLLRLAQALPWIPNLCTCSTEGRQGEGLLSIWSMLIKLATEMGRAAPASSPPFSASPSPATQGSQLLYLTSQRTDGIC